MAAGDFRELLRELLLGHFLFAQDAKKALDRLYIQLKTLAEDIDPCPFFSLLGQYLSYNRMDRRFSRALFNLKLEVTPVKRANTDDGSGPQARRRLYFFSMVPLGGL